MVFEYWFDPAAPEFFNEYSRESDSLRQLLNDIPGFRGVERFASCGNPGKYLALGFFDDETAVATWRNLSGHRRAQVLGRTRFFSGYRLRMCEVIRDYGPRDRAQAPIDSRRWHESRPEADRHV